MVYLRNSNYDCLTDFWNLLMETNVKAALIIGASILLSTIYYAKNTDYKTCVRIQTNLYKDDPADKRSELEKEFQAIKVCGAYLRTS